MASPNQRGTLLFRSTLNQISGRGITLSPEDVVLLWQAVERCVHAGNADTALLAAPVQVGPVTLYPRTLGAALWWEKYGEGWFAGDTNDEIVALGWLLAHANDKKLLQSTTTKARCVAHLVTWQLKVAWHLTLTDLAWGIKRVLKGYAVDAATGKYYPTATSPDWGSVIAQLCATYHRPPDYFLWEIGDRAVSEMLEKMPPPPGVARADAEAKSGFGDFVAFKRSLVAKYEGDGA